MAELRLVEHYVSLQGEGPRIGVMTQFVRFAGCNMKCAGWPCDTKHAIEPSIFMQPGCSYKMSPEQLLEACFQKEQETGARNICLTGGEPFLQPLIKLVEFIEALPDLFTLECFSNGSFLYPETALRRVNFIMDWKLKGSGEGETALSNRLDNALNLGPTDAIKFVVTGQEDLLEAHRVWEHIIQTNNPIFYVGAAWDRITVQEIQNYITRNKLPWLINVQVHKYIWDPQEKGV